MEKIGRPKLTRLPLLMQLGLRSVTPVSVDCCHTSIKSDRSVHAYIITKAWSTPVTMSKQRSTLWHSTMLLWHCCWCGRGLSITFLLSHRNLPYKQSTKNKTTFMTLFSNLNLELAGTIYSSH